MTREAVETAPSLVLTPAVVAHRGASGHRPEHTLDAYRTAIRMGVDDIELKHPGHHDAIGLPLDVPLLRALARHGLDHAWARVGLMSFEAAVLRRLAGRTRLPVIQLLDVGEVLTPDRLDDIDEYADGVITDHPEAALAALRQR